MQAFISTRVNTPPGTRFLWAGSLGTRALVFVAALSKYFWDDSFMVATFQQRAIPTVPTFQGTQQGREERKGKRQGDTSGLHPKAPHLASEPARFPLLCSNKNRTCLELSRRQKAGVAGRALRPATESAVSCPLEFSTRPFTLGLGKVTLASPFSADQQKCPDSTLSTLQHPPHPATAPQGQRDFPCA